MPRPKVFQHFVPPSVSLSAAAQLREDGQTREHLRQAIRAPLEIDTIYGKILQSTTFVLTDGETHTMEYSNPFALIHHMCNWKPGFGDMFFTKTRLNLGIYCALTLAGAWCAFIGL